LTRVVALGGNALIHPATGATGRSCSRVAAHDVAVLAEAEELVRELAEGSMRPKVEAAAAVAHTGGEAINTALDRVQDALAGRAGTRISI
jgi:carbamate kinase